MGRIVMPWTPALLGVIRKQLWWWQDARVKTSNSPLWEVLLAAPIIPIIT